MGNKPQVANRQHKNSANTDSHYSTGNFNRAAAQIDNNNHFLIRKANFNNKVQSTIDITKNDDESKKN